MTTFTLRQINTATKDLETFIKQAKRRLFEFETMSSVCDFEKGNSKKYKSASTLIKNAKKS